MSSEARLLGRPRRWTRLTVLSALVALEAVAACGSGDRSPYDRHQSADDGVLGDTDASSAACESAVCSRDLHSVLNACSNEVVKECPAGMGCAEGACVSACESAEKNQGTIGCSFWTTPSVATAGGPPSTVRLMDRRNSCFAAFVANTWSSPVEIKVEYEGAPLDLSRSMAIPRTNGVEMEYEPLTGPLPPGEIAILFLHQSKTQPTLPEDHIRCPMPAAIESDEGVVPVESGTASAFHISTDLPVSAYSIYPYGGALSYIPSATVLLPTSAWDTKYLVVNAWDARDNRYTGMKPTLQIVAAHDDTEVRILPNDDLIELPGGRTASDGRTKIYDLAKGELLQITQTGEMVGSPIESNKPVGVFGGSTCLKFPTTWESCCCDVAQQQIPPVRAWGSRYVAAGYESRWALRHGKGTATSVKPESVPWRLIGTASGTTLRYLPKRPPGAPEALSQGEAVTFWTDQSFVVESQDQDHPFYLAGYMTSQSYGTTDSSDYMKVIGDPEFVNVVPVQQYLDSYVFFTDMTYRYTTLVVVRHDQGSGFQDVVLDCAGPIADWNPIDLEGRYQYAHVTMVRGGVPEEFPGGKCANGRHEIRSEAPFALTVWGLDNAASYGYPGGAGLREISSVPINVPR
ncbi:MAG: IgGFc-binding protein [Labilithrix sp.]|nr:IgGFc-binding protein [Labilithrix sp.]